MDIRSIPMSRALSNSLGSSIVNLCLQSRPLRNMVGGFLFRLLKALRVPRWSAERVRVVPVQSIHKVIPSRTLQYCWLAMSATSSLDKN